jgi:dTDP-4-dehydrorhamnose reductase
MLGNAVMRLLSADGRLEVWGTVRSAKMRDYFDSAVAQRLISDVNVENLDVLTALFAQVCPDVVINCIGLVKQLTAATDPLQALPINAMLPHRLARLCELGRVRLIHVSTDCVFNGKRGNYSETDPCDALDLYGRSKALGEVLYPNTITLRTSIIGHELASAHGLLGWFLSQTGSVKGYKKAIFSGLPTVELATVIRDRVLEHPALSGVYHVASAPIAKLDLLTTVAKIYGKSIGIEPDDKVVVDNSLNADKFSAATGYVAPPWEELVRRMYEFK